VRVCGWLSLKPYLGLVFHRQEKPDLHEPPESAPLGILAAFLVALPFCENTLLTSELPHELQVAEYLSVEMSVLLKTFPHLLQENLLRDICPPGNFFFGWITGLMKNLLGASHDSPPLSFP
jgi:hypothetical protein